MAGAPTTGFGGGLVLHSARFVQQARSHSMPWPHFIATALRRLYPSSAVPASASATEEKESALHRPAANAALARKGGRPPASVAVDGSDALEHGDASAGEEIEADQSEPRRQNVKSPLGDRLTVGDTVLERHRRRSARLIQSASLSSAGPQAPRTAPFPRIGFSPYLERVLSAHLIETAFGKDAKRSSLEAQRDRTKNSASGRSTTTARPGAGTSLTRRRSG